MTLKGRCRLFDVFQDDWFVSDWHRGTEQIYLNYCELQLLYEKLWMKDYVCWPWKFSKMQLTDIKNIEIAALRAQHSNT